MTRRRVAVESPFKGTDGNYQRNTAYARACMLDSLRRGEAPLPPHCLFPLVLDDKDPAEREMGISAGLAWSACAELVAVYRDLGVTEGMLRAIDHALEFGIRVEFREGVWPNPESMCRVCFDKRELETPGKFPCPYCQNGEAKR